MLEVIFKSANTISTTQATELLPEAQVLKDDTNKDFTTSGEVMLEFHIVHIVAVLPPYQLHTVLKHLITITLSVQVLAVFQYKKSVKYQSSCVLFR